MTRGRSSVLADLALGLRMSVSGGRSGWARLAFVAVGVGVGVAVLMFVAALPTALDRRAEISAARDPGPVVAQPGEDTLLAQRVSTSYRGEYFSGHLVQPEGPDAPLPPGTYRALAPGEALVSPGLQRLLDSPEGEALRGRFGERVVGTIGPEGVVGPGELYFLLGSDELDDEAATRIDRFGRGTGSGANNAGVVLIVLVVITGLLVPVGGFIATAVRFGGEARDRRLAALRLIGADAATTRRVSAAETLVGTVGGVAIGAVLFALLRDAVAGTAPRWASFHTADLRPSPLLAALVVVLVPLAAVLVGHAALRHVVVEPLGVVRRGAVVRRRLWWRVALPTVGLVLLVVPLTHDDPQPYTDAFGSVLAGVALLLAGVALLLPWVVDAAVRRLGAGGLAWDLAVRRLRLESGTSVRAVSAATVAVASLITVHGLTADITSPTTDGDRAHEVVVVSGALAPTVDEWAQTLRDVPGVRGIDTKVRTSAQPVAGADDEEIMLTIGSCAALSADAAFTDCADGDVMVALPDGAAAPAPGTEYVLGENGASGATWTLPETTVTVAPPDDVDLGRASVLVTPAALGDEVTLPADGYLSGSATFTLARDVADVAEHVQTAAFRVDPTAWVTVNDPDAADPGTAAVREGLLIATVALLLVVGASLLVNVAEQVRERRRPLAVLVAVGTRRRTLGLSVLWQVAIPMVLGIGLAVAVGAGLASLLQAGSGSPVSVDWTGIGVTAGGAATVVLLTTAAILPLLVRLTRPTSLQGE